MTDYRDKEDLKRSFAPKPEVGTKLPNPKSVAEHTPFYLKESDGVMVKHKMINGKWHKEVVDANSNVTLEEVKI